MAEVGKAYVQIIPSAKGIKGSISNALSGEATSAGSSAGTKIGTNLVKTMTGVLAAAGIGKAITASITEGAALQQSIGGIETLFKENADRVIKYANEAYKTAGLSANDYMENVTSFSASLLQSLGGDTKKAGDAANQAIIDMSDNANKMGTSLDSIQMAYQGFARGQYQLLDNLKLGYGGTKGEMERLLADAQELSGVEYNIDNLNDVYSAIHVIQDELGITGTTAKEAAETFSGSFASMKAAADNLLGAMALGDDITDELNALAETVKTFLIDNLIPMVVNIVQSIPQILSGVMTMIGQNVSGESISAFLDGITEKLPSILEKGMELVKKLADGIIQNLPAIISAIGNILNKLIDFILSNLPLIMEKGSELITYLANGISQNMPYILNAIGQVLLKLLQTIISHLPQLLQAGVQLIQSLANGIFQMQGSVVSVANNVILAGLNAILGYASQMLQAGKTLLSNVISGITSMVGSLASTMASAASSALSSFTADWYSIGSNIISGIVSGITGAAGSLFNSLKNLASNALEAAKDALDIGSPSKVFRDEVGRWIPEGIAEGIASVDTPTVEIEKTVNGMISAADMSLANATITSPKVTDNEYRGDITINVYPSEGMDERRLADMVAQRINDQVRRKAAVYA